MAAKLLMRCVRLTANSWALGAEAALVVPLRLACLARGGKPAAREARLMMAEKAAAHHALVQAWQRGELGRGPLALSDGAVKHYLGYVRANRKRLLGE